MNATTIKYGLFLGRFSPLHTGHQHIIDKIIADGLIPVIIIGSANKQDSRTPYYAVERIHMLHLVYPNIKCITMDDYDCWDTWYNTLKTSIQTEITHDLSECTIYLHEKLEDLKDFTFRGIDYTNESYCKMYEIDGIHTTKLELSDIQIRAQAIRADLESNHKYLHPLVYAYIKEY